MYNINTETPLLSKKQHSTCSLFYSKKKKNVNGRTASLTKLWATVIKSALVIANAFFFFNTLHQQFVFAHNKIKFCDDQQQVLNAS